LRRALVALSVPAFAIPVSVAATHLHVRADSDTDCPICSAVVGKLETPGLPPVPVPRVDTVRMPGVAARFADRIAPGSPP